MMDSIADDLIDAIEDGKGGIETDRLAEALIAIVESEPEEQLHMADLLMESKNRQGTADMFFNAYRGGILYSGQTWAKMGMGLQNGPRLGHALLRYKRPHVGRRRKVACRCCRRQAHVEHVSLQLC